MRTFKLFFLFLLCSLSANELLTAQHSENHAQHRHKHSNNDEHGGCVARLTSGQINYMNRTLRERQNYVSSSRSGTIYIPIRHIIIRKSDGTGGITENNLQNAMNSLNAAYAVANIQFYECSKIEVNDDTYYDYHASQNAAISAAYEVSNVVNVFHVNSIKNLKGNSMRGTADFPGHGDQIFLTKDWANQGGTFIHEFAHYFSVGHTNSKDELVNGSNCQTAGDRICDTPASPVLLGNLNNACAYTGTATDANGDSYTPLTNNYMSVVSDSTASCRVAFTPGQIARIRYSAVNDRSYLTCSCFTYDYLGLFNFGADVSSHNYTTSANTFLTSRYNCDMDLNQLRVGGCSNAPNTGGDYVSVEFDVPPGTDKLRLLLKGGWQNGQGEVHIDGVFQRTFTLNTVNCHATYADIYIYNVSNHTQDGRVEIKLVDPEPGCLGDFNIDRMHVYAGNCNQSGYAKLPYYTNFSSGVLDNYWLTQSSNEFGRARLTNLYGPFAGGYHLVMDVNTNNKYATNQADLRVDLSNCASPRIAFRWKEFMDESHPEDGVYISNDGGENFAKVHDLIGAANNTWTHVNLDLAALAAINGMALTEEFVIRFQQYDNYRATTDGIAIDNVYVYGCNNSPAPLLVNPDQDAAIGAVVSEFPGWNTATNDVATVINSVESNAQVDVFPNPANDYLSLNFRQFNNQEVNVKVVNMLGITLYKTNHKIENAQSSILELSIQQLPVGVYSVVIEENNKLIHTKQFVIEH